MNVRARLEKELSDLWTTDVLVQKFRVSPMTLWVWRSKRGLPTLSLPGKKRDSVRFIPAEVTKWAKENKVEMYD